MNVFDIAQSVNFRLNKGDESKFPKTLLVVSELLYALKPFDYFGCFTYMVSCGDVDNNIMDLIHIYEYEYENDDYLGSMIELQNTSTLANQVFIYIIISTLFTGVAIGCYMIFS